MTLKKIAKWFLIANVGILALGFVLPAFGATNIDLSFANPNAGFSKNTNPIAEYIQNFYTFALWISGALAMLMIVAGGIRYATSAGKPDVQNDAKDMIFSALWGVALLFGAVLILNTVNPQLKTLSVREDPSLACPARQYRCNPKGPTGEYLDTPSVCVDICTTPGTQQSATCGGCVPSAIACPRTVMATTTCPGKIILTLDLDGTRMGTHGIRPLSGDIFRQGEGNNYGNVLGGVTDNLPIYEDFYAENEEKIPTYSLVWTYPYYKMSDTNKTGARCIIYAWRKPLQASGRGGTQTSPEANCNPVTGYCDLYNDTEMTDIQNDIRPC
ncbi:MAG: pilin [Patescibacteria group bacterium]